MIGGTPPLNAPEKHRSDATGRVVFVINSMRGGGAERHLLRLVEGLQKCGWQTSVFCLSKTGLFLPALESLGVEITGIPETWSGSPGRLLRATVALVRHLRDRKPDIVHCYLPQACLVGVLAARSVGVRHVITTRRIVHDHRGGKLFAHRFLSQVTDLGSSRIITVCEAARLQAIAEGTPPEKTVTIYNSIVPQAPARDENVRFRGDPVIGLVQSLLPHKGQQYLIEAMASVLRALPQAHLVIAGDGPMRTELERLADALDVGSSVTFLGERGDTHAVLNAFDIYASSSLQEGFPNSLLEAMVAGLPIVATAVGGVPELIEHGHNGLLVEPRSSAALASAIVRLACDVKLRAQLTAAARDTALTRFSPERELDQTAKLYSSLRHK